MLIVISLKKTLRNCFFIKLNVHLSAIKWRQRSPSAIIGAFLQTVFLFFSGTTRRCFLNIKKGRRLSEGLNNMFIIKGTPLKASFYGFYKDKHRNLFAIMMEILPHLG